jgi:hypothetical protein
MIAELKKRQFMSRNSPDRDYLREEFANVRKQLKKATPH